MEIKTSLIKCDHCGEMFMPGHDENGIPNGVGFKMLNGKLINLCSSCLMSSDFNSVLEFVRKKVWKELEDDDGKEDYECDGSGD